MRRDPADPAPSAGTKAPLDQAIDLVRGRLVRRAALRAASVGGWIGTALSALWLGAWLLRWLPLPAFGWLLAPIAVVAGLFGAFAALRFRASRSELALLVDRLLETDEVAITALGLQREDVRQVAGPLADVVMADADELLDNSATALKEGLKLQPPRHLRFLPLALLAVAAMTFLPRVGIPAAPAGPAGELASEADRLEQRKEQLERELGTELPEELDQAFAELVEAMRSGDVDRSEAAEAAEALKDKLDEHAQTQGGGTGQALRDAAEDIEDVDPELSEDLKDALADGDLDAAQEAVDRMRERMEQKSEEERERAAEELEKAAERAMKSPLPGLGGALQGEAGMLRKQGGSQGNQQGNQQGQQGGQQAGGQGNQAGGQQQGGQQQGGQQQGGQQGSQQGSGGQQGQQGGQQGSQTAGGTGAQQGGQQGGDQPGGGQGGGGLKEYLEQLEQQGLGGDGLAQEEAQSQMNQEMEQALGGAAGRLGGMDGATGQQGHGEGGSKASWGAGTGHSDQDEGTFDTTGKGHQDMDRQVDGRHSDWTVPFNQDHAPERPLDGIQAVATTVDVPLGDGPVDVETFRLSGSDERSSGTLIQAPPGYREAAEEAIQGEGIPRAYRDQVKTYFDAIE